MILILPPDGQGSEYVISRDDTGSTPIVLPVVSSSVFDDIADEWGGARYVEGYSYENGVFIFSFDGVTYTIESDVITPDVEEIFD